MSSVFISHSSICDWEKPDMWSAYLSEAQRVLGVPLTKLDEKDPLRRKVTSLEDAGEFICTFPPMHKTRLVFGQFKQLRAGFHITIHRGLEAANGLYLSFPMTFLNKPNGPDIIYSLFNIGVDMLAPFYSYADIVVDELEAQKRRPVHIFTELVGMFWLTHFCPAYVSFFGAEKVFGLPYATRRSDGGALFSLGKAPLDVPPHLRDQMMEALGRTWFVNREAKRFKLPEEYVLGYQQLRELQGFNDSGDA